MVTLAYQQQELQAPSEGTTTTRRDMTDLRLNLNYLVRCQTPRTWSRTSEGALKASIHTLHTFHHDSALQYVARASITLTLHFLCIGGTSIAHGRGFLEDFEVHLEVGDAVDAIHIEITRNLVVEREGAARLDTAALRDALAPDALLGADTLAEAFLA